MEGKIRSFPDKKKLKEYVSTKPVLQDMLKGFLEEEKGKSERERATQVQRGEVSKYLSIITLNINGLNAPINRHRVAEWTRKYDPTYAAYKRPISEQKTYTG